MEEKQRIINGEPVKVSDLSEVYELIPENLRDKYKIGFHAFFPEKYTKIGPNYEDIVLTDKIDNAKKTILKDGLVRQTSRGEGLPMLSTVMTEKVKLLEYISSSDSYTLGGVIIAVPKELRTEDGKSLFIGTPNEEAMYEEKRRQNKSWNRGYEPTSIGELVLFDGGKLDPMFILGTYSKDKENGTIDVTLNPNHPVYNKGIVPNDFFEKAKKSYDNAMKTEHTFAKKETQRQKKEFYSKTENGQEISLEKYGQKAYESVTQKYGPKVKQIFTNALTILSNIKNRRSKETKNTDEYDGPDFK